jgi:hypothetical protein
MSGSAIAAIQRRYIRRFKEANAYDLNSAKSLQELGLRERRVFQRLVNRGVFCEAPNLKYYIDINGLELFELRRRRILTAVLFIVIIVIVWGIFFAK